MGKKEFNREIRYWDNYYNNQSNVQYPTSFSKFCIERYLNNKSIILDLGCGNGRDTFFFAENGHNVIGIDLSKVAIDNNIIKSKEINLDNLTKFIVSDFTEDLANYGTVDVIYSRFTMHTITKVDEKAVINNAFKILIKGGFFFIECRTINDPLFNEGKKLSESERYTDHYRRFIDGTKFMYQIIKAGFQVRYYVEDRNFAKFHNENPVVARYVLTKT